MWDLPRVLSVHGMYEYFMHLTLYCMQDTANDGLTIYHSLLDDFYTASFILRQVAGTADHILKFIIFYPIFRMSPDVVFNR